MTRETLAARRSRGGVGDLGCHRGQMRAGGTMKGGWGGEDHSSPSATPPDYIRDACSDKRGRWWRWTESQVGYTVFVVPYPNISEFSECSECSECSRLFFFYTPHRCTNNTDFDGGPQTTMTTARTQLTLESTVCYHGNKQHLQRQFTDAVSNVIAG